MELIQWAKSDRLAIVFCDKIREIAAVHLGLKAPLETERNIIDRWQPCNPLCNHSVTRTTKIRTLQDTNIT
jgi:hypothetical protein